MNFSSPELLIAVIACVFATTVFMPPAATLVRIVRPYFSILGLSLVFISHLMGNQVSLRALVQDGIDEISTSIEEISKNYLIFSSMPFVWSLILDLTTFLMLTSSIRALYCVTQFKWKEWKECIVQWAFNWARTNVPFIRKGIKSLRTKTKKELVHMLKKDPNRVVTGKIPQKGTDADVLMGQLRAQGEADDETWKRGQISGTVYPVSRTHTELMNAAYGSFSWANPLHAGVWPTINQMEAEIISMTANMLGNQETDDEIVGATSSGGTESIILAIRAHLVHYGKNRSITHPELICCSTAHAAVDKACELMGIRKVVIDADEDTFTLNPHKVARHVTSNTIMIYSSAPTYPQGVIDPIAELSKIAKRFNIGLHVDACLGGFVLPFARQLGHDIPPFDFSVPGVTSMSVDTHKYGYASKGSSVVLYRGEDLRQGQYFSYSKWSGGLYATPTIAGSRPGGLLACAWAAMVSIGVNGYQSKVGTILEATDKMAEGIAKMEDVELCGDQRPTMIISFQSKTLDIYRIGDHMQDKGWSLHALQYPACLHICVTLNSAQNADKFVDDLAVSVQETRKEGAIGKTLGSAAIYGAVDKLPAGPADEMLKAFTDMTLTL